MDEVDALKIWELTEKKINRMVLKECRDCDGEPPGKRCIHYPGCKREVIKDYKNQNKRKTPIEQQNARTYIMENPNFLEVTDE